MYALTVDQQGSRTGSDRVPELLRELDGLDAALAFERTVGDELQALLTEPDAVVSGLVAVLRSGGWSIGLGIGPATIRGARSVREAHGPALVRAREAVEAAKRSASVHLAVRAGGGAPEADLQAALRLVGVTVQRRTPAQWRVIDATEAAADRAGAAASLGITVQAVSKALIVSGDDVVRDMYPLLARLLAAADERS